MCLPYQDASKYTKFSLSGSVLIFELRSGQGSERQGRAKKLPMPFAPILPRMI